MQTRVRVLAASLILLATLLAALASPSKSPAQDLVAPPGFFGVNVMEYQPSDFSQMAAANVGVARNIVPFQLLKHGKNKPYFWGYTDPIVRGTAEQGIDLIPMIYGSPPWVSDELNHTVLRGEAKKAWDDLLVALVQRYGPGGTFWSLKENEYVPYRPISVWQIWNEPNSITWWGPKPDPKQYGQVLIRSAAAIHSVDPNAQILTAGIVAKPTNAKAIPGNKFISDLFKVPGVLEATDGLGYHPYAGSANAAKRQLTGARRALNQRGGNNIPIWVTEVGWGSKGPKGLPLIKSETGQIKVMQDTFQMALEQRERLGLARLLWYQWRDAPYDLCKWCETSGLLNKKGKPKELLSTFSSIATR